MAMYSMTGFARVQAGVPARRRTAQLHAQPQERESPLSRSAVPPAHRLDALEMELRKILKENLVRGHVDLTLSVDRASQPKAGYNRELVAGYLAAFAAARSEHGLTGEPDLNAALRLTGALQVTIAADDDSPRLRRACCSRWRRCSSS